jgi:hypothetical protein
MLYGYLGPDTFLPLTSIIAAVAGGVLMFGRNLMALVRGVLRRSPGSPPTPSSRQRSERLRAGAAGAPANGPHPHVRPGMTEGESSPSARSS